MRRTVASLLLLLFSFSLIAQTSAALTPASKLPACCRRNGKHHCSMATSQSESSGPAFQAGHCELFPGAAAQATQLASTAEISRMVSAAFDAASLSIVHRDSLSLISCNRANQKRGPPSLL